MRIPYAAMDNAPERESGPCRKTLRDAWRRDKRSPVIPSDDIDPVRSREVDRILARLKAS